MYQAEAQRVKRIAKTDITDITVKTTNGSKDPPAIEEVENFWRKIWSQWEYHRMNGVGQQQWKSMGMMDLRQKHITFYYKSLYG